MTAFRERRRNFVETVNACDFLGQIVGNRHVVSPIGNRRLVSRRNFHVDGFNHVADRRADVSDKIFNVRFGLVGNFRVCAFEQVAERRADVAHETFNVGIFADFAGSLTESFRRHGNFIDNFISQFVDLADGLNIETQSLKHVDNFRVAVFRAQTLINLRGREFDFDFGFRRRVHVDDTFADFAGVHLLQKLSDTVESVNRAVDVGAALKTSACLRMNADCATCATD